MTAVTLVSSPEIDRVALAEMDGFCISLLDDVDALVGDTVSEMAISSSPKSFPASAPASTDGRVLLDSCDAAVEVADSPLLSAVSSWASATGAADAMDAKMVAAMIFLT